MRKIVLSLLTVVVAGGLVVGATRAFFSDTETSTGNVFQAGAIDLKVDNESYVTDALGNLVESPNTSWTASDLTDQLFFNFSDIKPGDIGEDTISLHVNDNNAWLCAAARVTEDSDVDYTEPELADDTTVNEADPENTPGELGSQLNFVFWADDGDNVFEVSEADANKVFLGPGPISAIGDQGQIALADSTHNVWSGEANDPVVPEGTQYIGKAWCFGTLTPAPVKDDDGNPIARGTGWDCNGVEINNAAQTDRVMGDIQFYAVQSRNNPGFTCGQDYTPNWPEEQRASVGANLKAYQAPKCDIRVNNDEEDEDTIQKAVNSANENQTVCVPDGIYSETVHISTPGLTLASENGPTNTATINGGVIVDAPDVTVTGFIVIPGNTEGSTAGFYLKELANNAVISYNDIDGASIGGSPRGIVNVISTDLPGVSIMNNHIHDLATGIYTNPHTGMWTIQYNDIDDNTAGIGQWNGADVLNNEFDNASAGAEAIGVDNAWDANGGVANYNNFLNGIKLNTYAGPISGTIDATHNFFDVSAATQVDQTHGTVSTAPVAGSVYPHQ